MIMSSTDAVTWPLAPLPGGWVLGPRAEEDGTPVKKDGYVTAQQFMERVGMSRAFYDLRRQDGGLWVCDPAVLIGDIPAWEPEDPVLWGVESGLLEEDGRIPEVRRTPGRRSRAARKTMDEPLARWRRQTRVYLSVSDLAVGLNIGRLEVTDRSRRGVGAEETIKIGSLKGWAPDTLAKWAPQMGRAWTMPSYITAALEAQEAGAATP